MFFPSRKLVKTNNRTSIYNNKKISLFIFNSNANYNRNFRDTKK